MSDKLSKWQGYVPDGELAGANLFDMDMKFAHVESLASVKTELETRFGPGSPT